MGEADDAASLALNCLNTLSPPPYDCPGKYSATLLIEQLNRQHKWRLDGDPDSPQDYTELVAQAFITAIEAECPEAEWMPRL